jgi:hypothetical protein
LDREFVEPDLAERVKRRTVQAAGIVQTRRLGRRGQRAGEVEGEVVIATGLDEHTFAFKGLGESWRDIAYSPAQGGSPRKPHGNPG